MSTLRKITSNYKLINTPIVILKYLLLYSFMQLFAK